VFVYARCCAFYGSFVSQHDIGLTQALQDNPLYSDLLQKISQKPELLKKLTERTSSLQVISVLTSPFD